VISLNPREVPQALQRRLSIALGVVLVCFLLLLGRLWDLQILDGAEMRQASKSNRIRIHRVQATRGTVVDRHGRILADSRPSFEAVLVPEDSPDVELTVENLAQFLDQSAAEMHALLRHTHARPPFEEITVKRDLSWNEVVAIETHQLDLPGVSLHITPRRSYPHGTELAHLLGFVGQVSPADLTAEPTYRAGDLIGKRGLEKALEAVLRGVNGGQQVEVDALGRKLRVLREVREVPGNTVRLTIDLDLQRAASDALGERDGSVVVLDPNTGEILAYVNHPSFDPNVFARGIRPAEWKALLAHEHRPLTDRAVQGQYPPGSVFKIVAAAAALEESVVTPFTRIYCPGELKLGKRRFRCWKRAGHGSVTLQEAIAQSCDVFFYQIAQRLGVDTIARYARAFGLGQVTGVEFASERAGTIPDVAWKRRRLGEPWFPGETLSVAIGQGYVTSTPMQVANLVAAVAAGKRMRPKFVKSVETPEGDVIRAETPEEVGLLKLREPTLRLVRQALRDVVEDELGTGKKARVAGVEVAGKTGTSQVVRLGKRQRKLEELPWRHRDHAWFVAYAPAKAPEVALAVLVEHAGSGGAVAAPVAHDVLQTYFDLKREGPNRRYAANRSTADRAF
jgi:penicillin-binding protein 2